MMKQMQEKKQASKFNLFRDIQTNYNNFKLDIDSRKDLALEELSKEITNRSSYLASLACELQRIIHEIENRSKFINELYNQSDTSTFIALNNINNQYIKNELIPNLTSLLDLDVDSLNVKYYLEDISQLK